MPRIIKSVFKQSHVLILKTKLVMKRQIFTIVITSLFYIVSNAQIKYFNDGNFIIGSSTSPVSGARLQVTGNSTFTATNTTITSAAMIRGLNGYSTASTPDFTYYGDTTTGIFHYAQSILGFTTAGSEKQDSTQMEILEFQPQHHQQD